MRPVLASMLLAACGPLAAVPRYPYVEDRSLALVDEVLVLAVRPDGVDVDARFHFEGELRDREATFPIGEGLGPAEGFDATSGNERLGVRPATLGVLPVSGAREAWQIDVSGSALARSDGALRVRYAQRGLGTFTYVLASGAYWRGPIRRLDVVVDDPDHHVASLAIEGRTIDEPGVTRHALTLFDVEPRSGIRLVAR